MKKLMASALGLSILISALLAFDQRFDGFLPHHRTEYDLASRHFFLKVLYVNSAFAVVFLFAMVFGRVALQRRAVMMALVGLYCAFLCATSGAWYALGRYLENGTGFSPTESLD